MRESIESDTHTCFLLTTVFAITLVYSLDHIMHFVAEYLTSTTYEQ